MPYKKTDLKLEREQTVISQMTIFMMENRLMIIYMYL